MNVFNRIVLVLLCIGLVVLSVSIIVLAWTIPNRTISWLGDAVEWIDANDGDLEKALLTTFSAFVGIIALIVLLIELVPRRGPDVRVTGLASGNATLSVAAIGQRIEEAVCLVPHVSEVRADVKARKKGVLVALDLQVDPEANLATVTDEACATAEQVLTERVHVALVRPPTARLHYRELRLQGRSNGQRRGARDAAPTNAPVSPPPETPGPNTTATPAAVAVAQPPTTPPVETVNDEDSTPSVEETPAMAPPPQRSAFAWPEGSPLRPADTQPEAAKADAAEADESTVKAEEDTPVEDTGGAKEEEKQA